MDHRTWKLQRRQQYGGWNSLLVDAVAQSFRDYPEDSIRATLAYARWHISQGEGNYIKPDSMTVHDILRTARNLVRWDREHPEPKADDVAAHFVMDSRYHLDSLAGRTTLARDLVEHLRGRGFINDPE